MTPRSVHFSIPGRLGGKLRHRTFIRFGKMETMTPKKTVAEEGIVRHFASEAMRGQPLLQGPLALHIHIIRHPPASWSKKKQATVRWITGKPDASNQLKLLEDGMNNTIFNDDSQIASLTVTRIYNQAAPERTQIDVLELEETP